MNDFGKPFRYRNTWLHSSNLEKLCLVLLLAPYILNLILFLPLLPKSYLTLFPADKPDLTAS